MPAETVRKLFKAPILDDFEAARKRVTHASGKLKVSQEALAIRAQELSLVPADYYESRISDWKMFTQKAYERREKARDRRAEHPGGPLPEYTPRKRLGNKSLEMILRGLETGQLDRYDALRIFNLSERTLNRVIALYSEGNGVT